MDKVELTLHKANFDKRMTQAGWERTGSNSWQHKSGYVLADDCKPVEHIGLHPLWVFYELAGTTYPAL